MNPPTLPHYSAKKRSNTKHWANSSNSGDKTLSPSTSTHYWIHTAIVWWLQGRSLLFWVSFHSLYLFIIYSVITSIEIFNQILLLHLQPSRKETWSNWRIAVTAKSLTFLMVISGCIDYSLITHWSTNTPLQAAASCNCTSIYDSWLTKYFYHYKTVSINIVRLIFQNITRIST